MTLYDYSDIYQELEAQDDDLEEQFFDWLNPGRTETRTERTHTGIVLGVLLLIALITALLFSSCKKDNTWNSLSSNIYCKDKFTFVNQLNSKVAIIVEHWGTNYTLYPRSQNTFRAYRDSDGASIFGRRYVVSEIVENNEYHYIGWGIIVPCTVINKDSLFHNVIEINNP